MKSTKNLYKYVCTHCYCGPVLDLLHVHSMHTIVVRTAALSIQRLASECFFGISLPTIVDEFCTKPFPQAVLDVYDVSPCILLPRSYFIRIRTLVPFALYARDLTVATCIKTKT